MKKNLILPLDSAELRRLAEEKLQQTAHDQNPPPLPNTAEALRLVHELQVHQVELDLQNQALHELYEQLEQKLERYAKICDVAPVGPADLIDRLQQAMTRTLGSQQWLMVGHLSLDHFNAISDTWFAEGDQMRTNITLRLRSCVNASDTVAWLGGDEFVLFLDDAYSLDECERILQRILAVLQIPFPLDFGGTIQISASLGVTRYPDDDAALAVLLDHARQALQQAQQAGGGRYHWFGQNPP